MHPVYDKGPFNNYVIIKGGGGGGTEFGKSNSIILGLVQTSYFACVEYN